MHTILVAEDDRGIQSFLKTILTRDGYAVECVGDGAEAMRRLDEADYHVVLLDLMMPNRSGHDVIDHLSAQQPETLDRVIVCTAGLHEATAADRLPILRKPFDIDELRRRVHAVAVSAAPANRLHLRRVSHG
jgi:DNA-binding response OmpR family regulator